METQPQSEFEDATSEATAAFVAMAACNVILLFMLSA
jgi:hypothetical protein